MYIDLQQAVEAYMPSMYRLAYSYLLNRSDAEDVVQEVFCALLQHPPRCDGPGQLRAWLMTATANKCKNLLNSGWRRRTLPLEDVHACPDRRDEVLEVRAAIGALPPELRGVVHLFYFEGMPTREIAALLGLSDSAVRSRLHRARKQMKEILGGE